MLGMPSRTLKTTNPNIRRRDMPYTIDCATSRLVQPCRSSTKLFRKFPVPLHIDIKPSQREIKKLATPLLPTNTPIWSLSHAPYLSINTILYCQPIFSNHFFAISDGFFCVFLHLFVFRFYLRYLFFQILIARCQVLY